MTYSKLQITIVKPRQPEGIATAFWKLNIKAPFKTLLYNFKYLFNCKFTSGSVWLCQL